MQEGHRNINDTSIILFTPEIPLKLNLNTQKEHNKYTDALPSTNNNQMEIVTNAPSQLLVTLLQIKIVNA
jgi:hypothetical protein